MLPPDFSGPIELLSRYCRGYQKALKLATAIADAGLQTSIDIADFAERMEKSTKMVKAIRDLCTSSLAMGCIASTTVSRRFVFSFVLFLLLLFVSFFLPHKGQDNRISLFLTVAVQSTVARNSSERYRQSNAIGKVRDFICSYTTTNTSHDLSTETICTCLPIPLSGVLSKRRMLGVT